ncbi:hypothetical protein EAO70_07890 [Streptomyces sp. adm13(2018)]|nr:hypothetical protein EAO70_07890 [Streptomyces sp. adm13(2018)]
MGTAAAVFAVSAVAVLLFGTAPIVPRIDVIALLAAAAGHTAVNRVRDGPEIIYGTALTADAPSMDPDLRQPLSGQRRHRPSLLLLMGILGP